MPVESLPKAELRRSLLAARTRTDPAALVRAASGLCRQVLAAGPVRAARSIAVYVPVGTEPGSVELLDALRSRVHRVLLPVVVAGSPALDWAVYAGADQLRAGHLSLREPVGPRLGAGALAGVDVVLVPALAVDRAGRRLGRGGGFYDRALAVVPASTPVAALLHDGELLDRLPDDPHDRRVAAVVTPELGWVSLGPGSGPGDAPVDDRPGHSAP